MLVKNAIQKIHIYAYDSTTGAAKTGDAGNITGYVSLDGTANAIDDTNPSEVDATNMPGVYVFDLTAAETNCDSFALCAKSSTSNIRIEPIIGFTTTGTAAAIAATVPDTQKVDVNTIKTQAITCAAGVTILASVGTAATSTAQTGDVYALANGASGFVAIKGETAAILADTGTDGVAVASGSKTGYALSATGLDAVVKMKALLDGTPSGSVVDDNDPDPTATAFETDLAEASNDHYNGAFCVFYSGALAGQSRKISDYDGTTKVLTVAVAFTEAPAAGDDFLIIGRSE